MRTRWRAERLVDPPGSKPRRPWPHHPRRTVHGAGAGRGAGRDGLRRPRRSGRDAFLDQCHFGIPTPRRPRGARGTTRYEHAAAGLRTAETYLVAALFVVRRNELSVGRCALEAVDARRSSGSLCSSARPRQKAGANHGAARGLRRGGLASLALQHPGLAERGLPGRPGSCGKPSVPQLALADVLTVRALAWLAVAARHRIIGASWRWGRRRRLPQHDRRAAGRAVRVYIKIDVEHRRSTPAARPTCVDTPHGCRVALLICYDVNIVEQRCASPRCAGPSCGLPE